VNDPFYDVLRLPSETTQLLRGEASTLDFVHVQSQNFGIKSAEARITSPFNMATAQGLGYCVEVAHSPALLDTTARMLGTVTSFSACNFLLYDRGAFIGIHTDKPGCEVNVLVLLAGPATVAEFRPLGQGETVADLLARSRDGDGLVGGTVTVPLTGPGDGVVFRAADIPHQRRPQTDPLLLLSICYGPRSSVR
jgi:hypothetical protein